jgi:HAE1 family hydrophobic/amphiphilic exporter-1/multidrug efflux pump
VVVYQYNTSYKHTILLLEQKIPEFMEEANNPTFAMTDVNLKFIKPEINVSIDREKPRSLGVSVIDIAQTLQLSKWAAFCYFMKKGKQYQVIGQFDQKIVQTILDLTSMYVKK